MWTGKSAKEIKKMRGIVFDFQFFLKGVITLLQKTAIFEGERRILCKRWHACSNRGKLLKFEYCRSLNAASLHVHASAHSNLDTISIDHGRADIQTLHEAPSRSWHLYKDRDLEVDSKMRVQMEQRLPKGSCLGMNVHVYDKKNAALLPIHTLACSNFCT